MKISIWFQTTEGPWGGANQFLRALAGKISALGHEVRPVPTPGDDVVLVNGFVTAPGRYLRRREVAYARAFGRVNRLSFAVPQWLSGALPRTRAAFVHRLDGVAEYIRGERTIADEIQSDVNALSDFTIFQSTYCRESFATAGVTPARSTIIYNGVDGTVFRPGATRRERGPVLRLIGSSWSPNPRKGFETLANLSLLPGVEVRFAGRWAESIDSRKVILLGAKSSPDLAEALRDADAMVHAAENEPCSNAILEALACGLPVLYRDSGGNRELAGDFGVPLTADLAASVTRLRDELDDLREKVTDNRNRFLIDTVAEQYVEAFERVRRT